MPLFCARNGLRATWRDLPPELLDLNGEELDAFALSKIFVIVHGLTEGEANTTGQMPKTLFLPVSSPANVEGRPADIIQETQRMHRRPQKGQTGLRPQRVLETDQHLMGREKPEYSEHRYVLRDWCTRELARQSGEQEIDQADVREGMGPANRELCVTILPELHDVEETTQIVNIGPLDVRTRHLYDPSGESGLEATREESVTIRQWMVHRLRSVFRSGPANDVAFIFGMLIRMNTSQLIQLKKMSSDRVKSSLMSMPGQKEFFNKKACDLKAIAENLGPPTISFTTSMGFGTDHHLACFVSQRRHKEEYKNCQVWDCKDEETFLNVRSGHVATVDEATGYYVHERTDKLDDNCKFHKYCRRSPLQNFSRW